MNLRLIALYSKNREEWVLTEQACHMQNVIIVTLYDTYGPDTAQYILNQTEVTTVVCSESKTEDALNCHNLCPKLKNIVQFEEVTNEMKAKCELSGIRLLSLKEVINAGKTLVTHNPPETSDITTFC